ncbi:serine hydrolase domain-containing protein [Hymenobacter cellulosivorans]|uniref:Beta-lactamase family protein n=1 Tax=Hymenobacter cellulosivorans TaxID=2932249 RepID=A0ABY4F3Y9_9BACT|nr:serine hydrolase domain-containing protein [Hymenobacter cellulosivorans]UOQ51354.1 beta-lactamase family protein [Hymenobacter cellulosivorans]
MKSTWLPLKELYLALATLLLLGLTARHTQAQALTAATRHRIDSVFARWDTSSSPGLVLGVVQHGQLIYQRAYGQADVARHQPLTTEHRFWVASMAKQFTAASIALLAEQGKLRLDDDIRRYLPELPYLGDTVRIRHLVHHTSGLRDGFTLIGLTLRGERHYTNANVLRLLSQQRGRNFRPGDRHEYNNGGYVLLAEIVARVSGQSFADFTTQHIFRPLGMSHTRFNGRISAAIPHLATGYTARHRKGQLHYRSQYFQGHTVGSSGLTTTLADLVRWDQNFYRNRLGQGRPELLRLLLTPGRLNDGTSTGYAFGLEVAPYRGSQPLPTVAPTPVTRPSWCACPSRS